MQQCNQIMQGVSFRPLSAETFINNDWHNNRAKKKHVVHPIDYNLAFLWPFNNPFLFCFIVFERYDEIVRDEFVQISYLCVCVINCEIIIIINGKKKYKFPAYFSFVVNNN